MKNKIFISLTYFFVASLFGLILRMNVVFGVGINFKNFLNTHSHIALLGWLYNLFLAFLMYDFLPHQQTKIKRIFWVTQFTFLGMLFSFPFVGYAPISIIFSTLYLFTSYWLIFTIFRSKHSDKYNFYLIKAGSLFLFLSSLGPYALGFFMTKNMSGSMEHHLSLFWFLHFLFNGFFFAVFAVMLNKKLELISNFSTEKKRLIYYAIALSTIPLFSQFVLMVSPSFTAYVISFISSFALLLIYLFIFKDIKQLYYNSKDKLQRILFLLFTTALYFKLILQVFASLPAFNVIISKSKSTLIIGYVHLVMLGLFSLFFIWYYRTPTRSTLFEKTGISFLILGILLTEFLLFTQGVLNSYFHTSIDNYYFLLFVASSIIPVGILSLLFHYFRLTKQ